MVLGIYRQSPSPHMSAERALYVYSLVFVGREGFDPRESSEVTDSERSRESELLLRKCDSRWCRYLEFLGAVGKQSKADRMFRLVG